jgi:O-antigen/teichoic acid export membrane protein
MIMTPWTWSIAYRRFHQGVLIRFGHSNAVGVGTVVRLSANIAVLAIGYLTGTVPGIVVATAAVSTGVMSEASLLGCGCARSYRDCNRSRLRGTRSRCRSFLRFYIPLALTSLLTLLVQPIGSAALSRMPGALESLAVWPVVSGLLFLPAQHRDCLQRSRRGAAGRAKGRREPAALCPDFSRLS